MSLPEDTLPPEESQPPQEPLRLSPARRRRARRSLTLPSADERAALLTKLAQRAYPSFEFFLFSLLCGAILGAGFILDAPSLLLLGILLAPLMTPWVGITLATVAGAARFFGQTLAGLLTGGILILFSGALAGLAARIWLPLPLVQATWHARLWWPNLFILALGAVLLVISFTRSEEKPILPSVMLTYELYLPLSAAGFGLGSGAPILWPEGLLVFLVHLAWATLFGVVTFAILGFRPLSFGGYLVGTVIVLIAVVLLVVLSGLGAAIFTSLALSPTSTPVPLPSPTFTSSPQTATLPHASPTRTPTLKVSPTLTLTDTPMLFPTPVYAIIQSETGGGARVRSEPGGEVLTTLLNGYMVEVLGVAEYNGVIWVHIRTAYGLEGWVLQTLLVTATPPTGW